jgi:hypothetical protein
MAKNKIKVTFFLVIILFIFLSLFIIERYKDMSFNSDSNNSAVLKSEEQNLKKSDDGLKEEKNDASQIMKKFLDSDMKWERGGEGDEIMVIKSYNIIKSEIIDNKASFTVKYKCAAGGYEFNDAGGPIGVKVCTKYFNENSDDEKADNITVDKVNNEEIVNFLLEKNENGWKIVSPALPPHVSIEAFLTHTKLLLGDSANMDTFNDFFTKK